MSVGRIVISDVAAAAGVSTTTVSHALSGRRAVSASTRQRIMEVIDELGYKPNLVARSLRVQQTKSVALLVVDISNPYYPTVAQAVHDGLAQNGYVSFIGITYGEAEAEEALLQDMVRRNVDGIIIQPMSLAPEEIRQLVGPLPLVLITDHQGALHADQVQTNDSQGIADAARHLTERGITQIGFISGPDGRSPGALRLTSFRAAAQALGVEVAQDWIEHVAYSREGGHEAGRRLLALPHRPRAIMCANDVIAVGLIDAAHELGLNIPHELAIVGFDDIDTASMTRPRLTTVRNPAHEVGLACSDAILKRITSGPDAAYTVHALPTELVPRDST